MRSGSSQLRQILSTIRDKRSLPVAQPSRPQEESEWKPIKSQWQPIIGVVRTWFFPDGTVHRDIVSYAAPSAAAPAQSASAQAQPPENEAAFQQARENRKRVLASKAGQQAQDYQEEDEDDLAMQAYIAVISSSPQATV